MDFFSRSKLIIADWGLSTNPGKFSYYTVLLWSKLIWIVIFFSCSVDGAVVISVPSSSKVTETLHKIGKWRMKFSSRRVRCVKHCSSFLFFFWPTFILLKLKIYLKTDNWIKYDSFVFTTSENNNQSGFFPFEQKNSDTEEKKIKTTKI